MEKRTAHFIMRPVKWTPWRSHYLAGGECFVTLLSLKLRYFSASAARTSGASTALALTQATT